MVIMVNLNNKKNHSYCGATVLGLFAMADLMTVFFTFAQSVTVSHLVRPTPICPFTGKHLTLNYYSMLCQILTHWSNIYHAKCTCYMLYDIWFTSR